MSAKQAADNQGTRAVIAEVTRADSLREAESRRLLTELQKAQTAIARRSRSVRSPTPTRRLYNALLGKHGGPRHALTRRALLPVRDTSTCHLEGRCECLNTRRPAGHQPVATTETTCLRKRKVRTAQQAPRQRPQGQCQGPVYPREPGPTTCLQVRRPFSA